MVMRPILFGAVVGVAWLLLGLPYAPVAALLPVLAQPVILAFAAGLLARPLLPGTRRWAR
jgi:hypothetical protein